MELKTFWLGFNIVCLVTNCIYSRPVGLASFYVAPFLKENVYIIPDFCCILEMHNLISQVHSWRESCFRINHA